MERRVWLIMAQVVAEEPAALAAPHGTGSVMLLLGSNIAGRSHQRWRATGNHAPAARLGADLQSRSGLHRQSLASNRPGREDPTGHERKGRKVMSRPMARDLSSGLPEGDGDIGELR